MMTIGNIAGADGGVQRGTGLHPQTDSVTRNLQNQITQAQKELREFSSNENMPAEEKMKKKQEIQQEIANLNQQLRQHQMEQKREQQSARKVMAGGKENAGGAKSGAAKPGRADTAGKVDGLAGMRSMLMADSSMKQAEVQGSVAARMEGRAGVLQAEIKQDAGGNTQAKEAELAETRQKALDAEKARMNTLARADQEMKKASRTEQDTRTEEAGKKDGSRADEMETVTGSKLDSADRGRAEAARASGASENGAVNAGDRTAAQEAWKDGSYVHVDIRL